MVGYNCKHQGYPVETYIVQYFQDNGFDVKVINSYYDILVTKNAISRKIEIKSCNLLVYMGEDLITYGRFDFTNPKNSRRQRTNDVDVCFVVCVGESYEIVGLMKAKSLKAKRYVRLSKLMQRKITRINKYIEKFEKV